MIAGAELGEASFTSSDSLSSHGAVMGKAPSPGGVAVIKFGESAN